jgi:hypothetical protein
MDNYMNLLRTIKDETKLNECLTSLGFEVDIPKSSTTGPVTSSSDPTKPKSDFCEEVRTKLQTKKYYSLEEINNDFQDSSKFFECLPRLGYSEDCVKVYKTIIEKDWAMWNYILTSEYDELLKIINDEDKLDECLEKLNFKVALDFDEPIVSALNSLKTKYSIPDESIITPEQYNEFLKNIFQSGEPSEKDKTAAYNMLNQLGYTIKEPDTGGPVTSSDLSLGDSEDCAEVKEEIENKRMAKGMYIFTSDYNELLDKFMWDEEQLDECLENLGFKVAVNEDDDDIHESSLKKKYNMPEDSLVLTRDQYNELLDIFFNSFEPPENYKTRVYNTLTYFLGYTIKEPDTGGPATATQPAKSSTTGPVTSSDPTKPKSDLSFPAGTPPAATPPDPLKNKLGMYHGCSYKGYEFRADIDVNLYDTKVFYEDEKDLDTIVRYFIFSNIVVFIVN